MSERRADLVEEILGGVVDLPPEARARFVEDRCRGDADLLNEVRSLLSHYERAPAFLEPPARAGTAIAGLWAAPQPGAVFGRYRIVRLIGAGGMGAVYLAEQDSPRRRVALKVLRPGVASPETLRRFRRESQVLARLQHSGIAQVFDAGAAETEAGPQPYFVMELIEGRPLSEAARGLPLRARLGLFAQVCDAVQHAHDRGVVHRDLKPGNILLTDAGQPKILDFGVARAVESDGHAGTLHTTPGQFVGTLAYMSPEQVTGMPADARSDVYALGVILYELLCDRPPLDLGQLSLPEAARAIREDDPTRLSTLDRALRGDLETIAGKALEKEAARRYQAAAELAADVRRFLRDEPVVARPPSRLYHMRKFATRNKGVVAAVGAAFVLLILGFAGTTAGMFRARDAERTVVQRLRDVQHEAAKATAYAAFLRRMITSADPDNARGRDITVLREMLDRFAAEAWAPGTLPPEVRASILLTLGETFDSLGDYARAFPLLEEAVAEHRRLLPGSLGLALSLQALAHVHLNITERPPAEGLYRECMEIRSRVLGPNHTDTLYASIYLARTISDDPGTDERVEDAIAMCRRAIGVLGPAGNTDLAAMATHTLAILLSTKGDLDGAEAAFREALAIYTSPEQLESSFRAGLLISLGRLLVWRERFDEAEAALTEGLALRERLLGPDHFALCLALAQMSLVRQAQGRFDEAVDFSRRGADITRGRLGPEHVTHADALIDLGGALLAAGRRQEAAAELARALEVLGAAGLPPDHPFVRTATERLARATAPPP